MEFLLNSAWALLGILVVCFWFRSEHRTQPDRRLRFVSLVMLFVILFPVISVSDDLWSIQNPAETDTCQRRDHVASSPHSTFPAIAAPPEPFFAELTFGYRRLSAPNSLPLGRFDDPARDPIQTRPPPTA